MNRLVPLIKTILMTFICFLVLGCSGFKKYGMSEFSNWPQTFYQESNPIKIGEAVKVQIMDGQQISGSVGSVDELGFVLDGQHVGYSTVEFVQIREVLWVPTVVIGATSAFVLFLFTSEPGGISTD